MSLIRLHAQLGMAWLDSAILLSLIASQDMPCRSRPDDDHPPLTDIVRSPPPFPPPDPKEKALSTEPHDPSGRFSRRRLLATMSVAAAGAAAPRLLAAEGAGRQAAATFRDGFGRLFPTLRPFAEPSPKLFRALLELGRPGGILDARDDLAAGPVRLVAELELSRDNANSPLETAGSTFVGQFMDHDLTFDRTSSLGRPAKPRSTPNARTPAFDLDSVYGGGPVEDPALYRPGDPGRAKLKVGHGGRFEDLPRDPRTRLAIIADPRNDENLILSGLHAAFLLFHNAVVDRIGGRGAKGSRNVFARARRLTTWHYQWMVLHEFLPLFVGQPLVDDILENGRKVFRPSRGVIPVEFQGAAYRFGHSLVRPSYRANLAGDAHGAPFFGMIFDPAEEGVDDPGDLRGGCRAPRRFVGWQTFFDFGGPFAGDVRPNKLIDTKLSTPLFQLPVRAIAGAETAITSLPQRTLLRHVTWGLPSGQSVARALRLPALGTSDLAELRAFGVGLEASTPLWYYILKEAQVVEGGIRLGPVGGRIVGEVIVGLLELDPGSFLSVPGWKPRLPARGGRVTGEFRMVDFLTFAGVDPTSRGQ